MCTEYKSYKGHSSYNHNEIKRKIFVYNIKLYKWNLQTNSLICGRHIVQQLLGIFADKRFLVVASNIMPCDAIVVHVIQNGQARFAGLVDVEFGIIGLWDFFVSCLRPRVVAPTLWNAVGRLDLLAGRWPKPTEQILWLQIGTSFASLEVAQTTGRPDVWHIVGLNQTEDQIVFLLGLECDQVHAVFTAQIAGVQPVYFAASQCWYVAAEEQILATVLEFFGTCMEIKQIELKKKFLYDLK